MGQEGRGLSRPIASYETHSPFHGSASRCCLDGQQHGRAPRPQRSLHQFPQPEPAAVGKLLAADPLEGFLHPTSHEHAGTITATGITDAGRADGTQSLTVDRGTQSGHVVTVLIGPKAYVRVRTTLVSRSSASMLWRRT